MSIYCLGYGHTMVIPLHPPVGCWVSGDTLIAASKAHIDIDSAAQAITQYVKSSSDALCQLRTQQVMGVNPAEASYRTLMDEIMVLSTGTLSQHLHQQLQPIVERWHSIRQQPQHQLAMPLVEQLLSVASNYLKINIPDAPRHQHEEDTGPRKKSTSHGKNLQAFYSKFCCHAVMSMSPQVLEPMLDDYFRTRGMLIGAQVRTMPINGNGITRGPYTIMHMEQAVHELEYNKLYSETVMIAVWYWGWLQPDVESYSVAIQQKHALFDQLYNKHKQDYEKKSSANSKVVLYVLLTMLGYPHCHIYMHELITSDQTIQMYNDILVKIHKDAIAMDNTWKQVFIPCDGICHAPRTTIDIQGAVVVLGGTILKV